MSRLTELAARVEESERVQAAALGLFYQAYQSHDGFLNASESERATLAAADRAWRAYDALCAEYLDAFDEAHPWAPDQPSEEILAAYPSQLRAYLSRHLPTHGIWAVL